VRVGQVLHGYCGGFFGDSYDDKRVEAIGYDWVVCRDQAGRLFFGSSDGTPIEDTLKVYMRENDE
jgi:hypothetical protein